MLGPREFNLLQHAAPMLSLDASGTACCSFAWQVRLPQDHASAERSTLSIAIPLDAPNLIATVGRDALQLRSIADRMAVATRPFVFKDPSATSPAQ
jgi:hypothetical protein